MENAEPVDITALIAPDLDATRVARVVACFDTDTGKKCPVLKL